MKKRNGKYLRYYCVNSVSEIDKSYINLLRQNIPNKIIVFLFFNPNACQRKISRFVGKHPSTIFFHIEKLLEKDILYGIKKGNKKEYGIKDPDYVISIMSKFHNRLQTH